MYFRSFCYRFTYTPLFSLGLHLYRRAILVNFCIWRYNMGFEIGL
jgi:hypothetical protein